MISVNFSVLFIAALVFLLVVVLSRLFFEPLAHAMDKRREVTEGAERFRTETSERVEGLLATWRDATGSARAEGHQELDRLRTEALAEKARRLDAEREKALGEVGRARETLRKEGEAAVRSLESDADRLASEIASRLLGRQVA